MSDRIKSALEILSNIMVLVVGATVMVVIVRDHKSSKPDPRSAIRAGSPAPPVAGVRWHDHPLNLLIAMRIGCPYCEQSLPFYRNLLTLSQSGHPQLSLATVFPDRSDQVEKFLEANNLRVQAVSNINLGGLGFAATPTVLLVNRLGIVDAVWVGLLGPAQQKQVMRAAGLSP
jgi:hypothetical protein